jgi:hypothetical protein
MHAVSEFEEVVGGIQRVELRSLKTLYQVHN